MDLNQIMAQETASVLQEATGIVTNRLVMESLLKNGKVTIEEATFLNKIASEVIQESAEDFIPDTITVEEAAVAAQPVEEAVAAKPVEEAVAAKPVEEAETKVVEEAETKVVEEAAGTQEELTESEAIVNNLINKLF